jgi:hypothetical protein
VNGLLLVRFGYGGYPRPRAPGRGRAYYDHGYDGFAGLAVDMHDPNIFGHGVGRNAHLNDMASLAQETVGLITSIGVTRLGRRAMTRMPEARRCVGGALLLALVRLLSLPEERARLDESSASRGGGVAVRARYLAAIRMPSLDTCARPSRRHCG